MRSGVSAGGYRPATDRIAALATLMQFSVKSVAASGQRPGRWKTTAHR